MSEATVDADQPLAQTLARALGVMLALLLPLAYSNGVGAPFFTIRAAMLICVVPFGLVMLALLARTGHRPAALGGAAFLAVAAAATVLSPSPLRALTGPYGSGTGLVYLASLVACWAIGASITQEGAGLVRRGLLVACAVNAVVAALQVFVDLSAVGLGLYEGRAPGLLGNPVHLAVLLTAAVALVAHGFRPTPGSGALLVLFATGAFLSGSRVALLLFAAGTAVFLVKDRSRRAVVFAGLILVSAGLGQGLLRVGEGQSAANRIDAVGIADTSTLLRVYSWQEAVEALQDRPVLGYGPGQYLQATSPHRGLRFARAASDSYFRDAHNIVVEVATTTGFLGLAAFAAWLVPAARRARGPMLAFAAGAFLMLLVQPQLVGTVPVAVLALGVAAPASAPDQLRPSRGLGILAGALTAVSLAAAVTLVAGDLRFRQAYDQFSVEVGKQADRLLPRWPDPAGVIARIHGFEAATSHDNRRFLTAAEWHREAAERDPGDPKWWNELGYVLLKAGDADGAEDAFRRALDGNPYSRRALVGVLRTRIASGDCEAAERQLERVRDIFLRDERTLERELERCSEEA